MDAELKAARERLAEAIVEVDRVRFGDRTSNEILTHWAVVYSHGRFEGDDYDDSTQVCHVRSDGMTYWMAHGILAGAAESARLEPWTDPADPDDG